MSKVLIISPHLDDEVYGCSSYLNGDPDNLVIVYATIYHSSFPEGENIRENENLINELGCKVHYMNTKGETNCLDLKGQAVLIDELENIISKCKPDMVLLPYPSYNQDHRAIYDAALTAMRPHDRLHFVKRILLYEQPDVFGTLRKSSLFNPNYFRALDIENKKRLIQIYSSQMRGHRTLGHVEAIARVRGMQSNFEFAEAFEVVRWVE